MVYCIKMLIESVGETCRASRTLESDGKRFRVSDGMLVSAEVNLGSRTVMEYLLSPVQKVTHEAGREM